jgi:hypothetical protein
MEVEHAPGESPAEVSVVLPIVICSLMFEITTWIR